MLCLSGFELYSRWVPLIHPAYFSSCLSLLSFQFQHAPRHLQQRLVIYCYSLLEFFRCYLCRQIYHMISIQNINKNALTAAYISRLLGHWIEKWGGDFFYKKHDLLAKGCLLPTLSTSILFVCFWIDLVHVLATTKNTSAVAGYTRV